MKKKLGIILLCMMIGASLMRLDVLAVSQENPGKSEENTTKEITSKMKITGFKDGEADEPLETMHLENKTALESVQFPKELSVYLEQETKETKIPVQWECQEDFMETKKDRYYFYPKWDENTYCTDDSVRQSMIPYIEVIIDQKTIESEPVKKQAEEQQGTQTAPNSLTQKRVSGDIFVGASQSYKDVFTLLQDSNVSGDITVHITEDITETVGDTIELPNRITSFTIVNDDVDEHIWNVNRIFANGIPLTIGEHLQIDGISYNMSKIYGGGNEADIYAAPHLTILGSVNGTVYGGGYNSSVFGDIKINLLGKVTWGVFGGGYAYGEPGKLMQTANVTGNISIVTGSDASTNRVIGGGTTDADRNGDQYRLVANVYGNTTIYTDGLVDEIIGGGYAYYYSTNVNVESTTDVSGQANITLGANARAQSSIKLYGGGYALSELRVISYVKELQANVGSTYIMAIEDSQASVSQEDEYSFSLITGGGYAAGRYSVADVMQTTSITTGRVCWESALGVVGGGYAIRGGQANVVGSTNIVIQGIENQTADYENVNAVYGGGYANSAFDDSNDTKLEPMVSVANVGGTNVTIKSTAQYAYGSFDQIGLLGGGYADGSSDLTPTGYTEYDRCSAIAKVLGDISVTVESGSTITDRVIGGGYVEARGNASISGSIQMKFGDACTITNNMIGGSIFKTGSIASNDFILCADIGGNVSTVMGDRCKLNGWYFGGSYGGVVNSTGKIGGDVINSFGENTTINNTFAGGGYAGKNGVNVNIAGSVKTTFKENTTLNKNYIGGGYCGGENTSADIGGLQTIIYGNFSVVGFMGGGYVYASDHGSATIGSNSNPTSASIEFIGDGRSQFKAQKWTYFGGNATQMNADATIYGDKETIFDGTIPTNSIVNGGYAASNAGAMITGDNSLIIKNTELPVAVSIYGGGYATGNGDVRLLKDCNITLQNVELTGWVYGAGRAAGNGNSNIEGNVHFIADSITSTKSLVGGGYGEVSTASADVFGKINIQMLGDNDIAGALYVGGYQNSDVGSVDLQIVGAQANTVLYSIWDVYDDKSSKILNDYEMTVGDGVQLTGVSICHLFGVTDLHITDQAILKHSSLTKGNANNVNKFFWNINTVQLDQGGFLLLTNENSTGTKEIINGNFIGGGKLTLLAAHCLEINGTVSEKTELSIIGTPQQNEIYITALSNGTGTFTFINDALMLVSDVQDAQHTKWSMQLKDTLDITTETLKEGCVGELYQDQFTCVSNSTVNWMLAEGTLPEGLQLNTADGTLTGTPMTKGSYTFKIKAVTASGIEEIKEFTLEIKKKDPIPDPVLPENNAIQGVEVNDVYIKGTIVTFEAKGAGMDNVSPIRGDVRWKPESWKVNPSGVFEDEAPFIGSFDTSGMRIGEHRLKVIFRKQIFDGAIWQDTDLIDEQSVLIVVKQVDDEKPEVPVDPSVPNKPELPDDPVHPSQPSEPGQSEESDLPKDSVDITVNEETEAPKTGDVVNVLPWLYSTGTLLGILILYRRRLQK